MARNVHQEIKSRVVWVVLITLLALVGIWQTKVTVARELQASVPKTLPPPLKTRFAIRPPPKVFTGNVVEDYIARCNKGLTDQEIGWILEDFRYAGLDYPPADGSTDEKIIAYHRVQNRWYRDAIVDCLRLTPDQSAEVGRMLAEFLQEVSDAYLHGLVVERCEDLTPEDLQSAFRYWIFNSQGSTVRIRIAPTGLFTATAQQQDIFENSFFAARVEIDPFDSELPQKPEIPTTPTPPVDPSLPTLKGKTAATYPIGEDYPIPVGFWDADQTFPILKSQQLELLKKGLPVNPDTFIQNVRHLHPAQLKAMLLFNPAMVNQIQAELDRASH